MASLECIDADDLINGVDDVLKHNSFLLMSSLEETMQAEEYMCNNEELDNLIRTLEAEINPHTDTKEEHCDLPVEPRLLVDGHDCWASINDLDIEWDDMELMASSPSDDLNLCVDVDFGTDEDFQLCYEVPLGDHGYSSVWLETHDTAIYY